MRLTNTLLKAAAIITFVGSLLLLPVSSVVVGDNSVKAEDTYGSFDASGQYQYHPYGTGPQSSSLRPSIGQPGYETLR